MSKRKSRPTRDPTLASLPATQDLLARLKSYADEADDNKDEGRDKDKGNDNVEAEEEDGGYSTDSLEDEVQRTRRCFMGDDVTQLTSPLGDRWNVAIIVELWTTRNAEVHGRDDASSSTAELEVLRRRMRNVYSHRNKVEPRVAPIFEVPMEHRLARGAVYVKNWLAIHESLVHTSDKRATERAIRGARSLRTPYFTGHIDDPG